MTDKEIRDKIYMLIQSWGIDLTGTKKGKDKRKALKELLLELSDKIEVPVIGKINSKTEKVKFFNKKYPHRPKGQEFPDGVIRNF
ncbi:MAG: hypothetical protein PHT54_03475 [Candidatus Nanoarchaeia archaeon]|nr:hypothetical protein [Candidatus Nanoarchaeia archaeon]